MPGLEYSPSVHSSQRASGSLRPIWNIHVNWRFMVFGSVNDHSVQAPLDLWRSKMSSPQLGLGRPRIDSSSPQWSIHSHHRSEGFTYPAG